MASRTSRSASSRVSPTATQPGRSGTCAPQLLSPRSTTTMYRTIAIAASPLLEPGLFEYRTQGSWRNVQTRLTGHGDRSWLTRMCVLPVTATRPNQSPAIVEQEPDELAHLHSGSVTEA